MALTTESGNKVWQKVKNHLSAVNANPEAQNVFLGVKAYLAQQKRNPDLQFIPFTAEQAVTNNGTSLVGGACTLYGIYAKGRRTTGTTSSFLAIHDAADNNASTTTIVTSRFKAISQEFQWVSGVGLALATDAVISAATAVGGATESSTADAADGFIIVGA